MKKLVILFLTLAMTVACSSDDSDSNNVTSAKITLVSANGSPVSGLVVYAYDEDTWDVIGDNPQFADFQAATGNDGVATFSNLTTDLTFNELSNFSQTFRFSVRYNINGTDKVIVRPISFDLGDDKSDTIILN